MGVDSGWLPAIIVQTWRCGHHLLGMNNYARTRSRTTALRLQLGLWVRVYVTMAKPNGKASRTNSKELSPLLD